MDPGFRLDSANWQRARDLLLDALDKPAGERSAFIEAVCAGEPALRAEVESLLGAHLRAEGFLESLDTTAALALVETVEGTDPPPRNVAQYRIDRLLGRGGMGMVYLAHDTRLDRTVALKFLPVYLSSDDAARQRLLGEARVAAALDHINIGVVHEIAESDTGQFFIAMAYYEGCTLRDWIDEPGRPLSDCVFVARQIADGLSAAHRRGIVHSDIKPSNIVLTPDRVVKILDFGIARLAGAEQPNGVATPGTVAYMSPEQTRSSALEPPSDVWSLGVVLYEMISGRRPFAGVSDVPLIRAIRDAAPAPLTALRPDVTPQLAQLVNDCLQHDPAARPTADVVAARLRALDASVSPVSEHRSARSWAIAIAALAMIVLLTSLWARRTNTVAARALDEAIIAVLPLSGSVADTALHRLGRDLVITLSSTLRGGSDLRVVEAGTVLAQPDAEASLTVDAALEFARSLGAGRFLHGTLVRSNAGIRADVALVRSANGAVLARASAIGTDGDLNTLTDSLTWSLLRQVWGRDPASIPSLAAITTHSLPALRAYVQGEQAMARADWAGAIAEFERAFAADSTFWFAYWRSLYPRVYESASPPDQARMRRVFEQRSTFPPADRLLLESRMANGPGERLPLLKRVTAQFPHYWPGWYDYANYFVHFGPFLGSTYDDARTALQRVTKLNPSFKPAWEHLFWIALQQRDTALATRAFAQIDAGFMRLPYRALLELSVTGTLNDSTREALHRLLANVSATPRIEQAATGLLAFGFPAAQVQLLGDVASSLTDPELVAMHRWARASAWAARGAWDSAFVDLDRSRRTAPSDRLALRGYGLATLGVVLGSVTPDAAARLRPDWKTKRTPPSSAAAAELAWLDGILAALRGDTAAHARAHAQLQSDTSRITSMLRRSLAAFALLARGDTSAAAKGLTDLETENAQMALHMRFGADHPFVPAVHRMAASGWLLAIGDTVTAARLLTWHEAVLSTGYPVELASRVAEPVALFRRAGIEEARQQTGPARRHYQAFLERYDRPAAPHATMTATAVEALARLRRN